MKIIDEGVVFSAVAGTARQSCAFPGICVLPDGRWLASCRAAPTKVDPVGQHVLMAWSDDEGRSWRETPLPFIPAPIDGRPGLFRAAYFTALGSDGILAALLWVDHSRPELPYFNADTEGLLDSRIFLSISWDGGATWPAPKLMDTTPFVVPTPLTGPVLRLGDDELACQFELNKHYREVAPWRHSSVMMFSRDGGISWPELARSSHDPTDRLFLWDQRPAYAGQGRVIDFFWTFDNVDSKYLNIHASESFDNGRTWSVPTNTGVPGQPAQPVFLADGRIVMVYVDRTEAPRLKLRLSEDDGHSWPPASEMLLAEIESAQNVDKGTMVDAWAEMEKFSLGLPATALLSNDDILIVYYTGPHADFTDVRWIRVGL